MSAYREFTGKSVEEALRNAREAFGAGLDDLDFEILTPGSRGVLGMGAEPARIVAAPRSALGGAAPKRDAAASQPLPPQPPREDRPRLGDRDRDRGPRREGGFAGDRDRGPRREGGFSDRGPRREGGFAGDRDRGPRREVGAAGPAEGGFRESGFRDRAPRSDDRPARPDDRGPRPATGDQAFGAGRGDRSDAQERPSASAGALEGGDVADRATERGDRPADRGAGGRDRGLGGERREGRPWQDRGSRPAAPRAGEGEHRRESQRGPRGERPPGPADSRGGAGREARPGARFDLSASEVEEVNAARGSLAAERADLEAAEASPEALKAGQEILEELMRHLGFAVRVEMDSGETSRLNVVGEGDEKEALGALIGRKGERLSALQHLVNLMLSRKMDAWTRVLVDVEDYRGRRERQLRDLATRAAERVIETGKMLQLEPMPALERRWVHIALREHPNVATQSIGEEPNRRVVVVPRSV
jgi:spoIIIJ-associated protein